MTPRSTIVTGLLVGLIVLAVVMTARSLTYRYQCSPPTAAYVVFKTYKVLPSEPDGASNDCPLFADPHLNSRPCAGIPFPTTGIGCDTCWPRLDTNGNIKYQGDGSLMSEAPDDK